MSTFLFVSNPFYSHTASLMGIADELLARGHDIAWVTDAKYLSIASLLYQRGIRIYTPAGMDFGRLERERAKLYGLMTPSSLRDAWAMLASVRWHVVARSARSSLVPFGRQLAELERELGKIIRRVRPAAVVAELCFYVSEAARTTGVPWVYVANPGSVALPEMLPKVPPDFYGLSESSPRLTRWLVPRLCRRILHVWMKRLGSPFLNIIGSIPELEGFSAFSMPTYYVGSILWDSHIGLTSWDWINQLPDGIPVIYASLGSRVTNPDFYRLVTKALGSMPVQIVISTGKTVSPSEMNLRYSNVRVVDWIPGRIIFGQANAAIIHGGFNTTVACLSSGVPALVVGWYGDQGFYARRFVELRAGLSIPSWRLNVENLRSAIESLLSDGSFTVEAQRLRQAFSRYGGPKQAADLILRESSRPFEIMENSGAGSIRG